ncbi:MAG: hypothetical protein HY782_23585 [Chloroflexi bacterium]|nr:hypothetical protein [Chloroflexota bacterium]
MLLSSKSRRIRLLLGIAFLLVLLAACSDSIPPAATPPPASTATPRASATQSPLPTGAPAIATPISEKGGEFRQVLAQDAVSFHPFQTTDPASALYQANVYASGLWVRDPQTLQPIPNMAESWTISPDGKTYTFKLRPDLKWSDGKSLTALDFQWTFEQASKPANKYPYLENLKDIVSYTAKDSATLEIVLKDAVCVGLTTVDAITPLPKHIWEKLDWHDPAKNPEIQNPSVVSGPFKLKEWQKDDHATFVRNDLFFRGAPNFDALTVRIVRDPSRQLQMLQSGEVDMAPVGVDDYAPVGKWETIKAYNWEPAAATFDYLAFNFRRPLLQDVQVRRALAAALPRQTIANGIFRGLAKPIYSMFPPANPMNNSEISRYDYNIDAAKATLQKAGYKWDASGNLLDKSGKRVRLRILFNTGNLQHFQIASLARTELQKLGIDSEAAGLEFPAFLAFLRTEPFDYDLYVLGWRTPLDPYFTYQIWSEKTIPDLNSGAYVNKEIDKLFDQANRPPCDAESRKKVFAQIQKTIADDVPYIFLTHRAGYALINTRVVPNAPTALGINYYPEQWYIR